MKKIIICVLLLASRPGAAQHFTLSPDEVLKAIFPDAAFIRETRKLDPETKKQIEKEAKSKLPDTWNFVIAKTRGKIAGYAVSDQVLGKTEFITFLTAINPDGSVKEVEILAYREAYGGEVREKKFLDQYKQKKSVDPLGKDIRHITGATISCRSVTRGVARALLVWNHFYGKK